MAQVTHPAWTAPLVVALSLALGVLAGCSSPDAADPVVGTPATRPATTEHQPPVLDGEVMAACSAAGVDAWCGRLPVPEDRSAPAGTKIELWVMVVPAASPSPEPDAVFFLAGGPGGAATESWSSAATVFADVHARRDIVLVDQRGTGLSNQLMLPEPPDLDGMTDGEIRQVMGDWVADAFANLPGDYRHYTSRNAADDLDAVRDALGYKTIDLYGGSYGATLAQYYLRLQPDRVRTVVVDGGTLLDVPVFEVYAGHSQDVVDRIFARCAADEDCRRSFPDPAGDLARAIRRLSANPATTDVIGPAGERIVVDGTMLARQVHQLILTHRSGEVPLLVHLAARGEVDRVSEMMEQGGPDPTRLAMFWSIVCSEGWARFRPSATRRQAEGSYLSTAALADADNVQFACSLLELDVPSGDSAPVRADTPVLLLNGSDDPQDPPANVADAAVELPNSLAVVVPGQGHTVGHLGCLPEVVASFVEAGSIEGLDLGCVDEFQPPPFVVDSG